MRRRQFTATAATVLALPAAFAQSTDYPNRPVRVVVAFTGLHNVAGPPA
ncbi:MAG: hypothetical protein JWP22_2978 [Ramlibacter sp.]|jgi:tripartite-type tricarboxylate transporter receptor subunit TctC|nr:hypothetical protein [Ramlibacter sp.]MDB5914303.1 hypothetical protein [Ramlibacter sp.]